MTCAHCGTDIADKALICYRCGRATTEPRVTPPSEATLFEPPKQRRPFVGTVVVLTVLALLLAWYLSR